MKKKGGSKSTCNQGASKHFIHGSHRKKILNHQQQQSNSINATLNHHSGRHHVHSGHKSHHRYSNRHPHFHYQHGGKFNLNNYHVYSSPCNRKSVPHQVRHPVQTTVYRSQHATRPTVKTASLHGITTHNDNMRAHYDLTNKHCKQAAFDHCGKNLPKLPPTETQSGGAVKKRHYKKRTVKRSARNKKYKRKTYKK